jgi:tetratricopeptide (TPR) repeat protein
MHVRRPRFLPSLPALALAIAATAGPLAPPALAAAGGTPAAEVRGPASALGWWTRLDQLIERQAFPAAQVEIERAMRDPKLAEGTGDRLAYMLGYVQRRAGRPAEAGATLGTVPRDSRWFLPALAERAAIRRSQGDDTGAIALYDQLLALADEGHKDAARAPLADLYFTSGQYPKALEHYRVLANAFGPYQERGLFAWGWSLLRLKQEDAATNVWKQALERYPTSRYAQAVRLALGNVMLARGDHLAASTYYNEAARHGRDEALMARAELLAGEAYADAKDYALAISHYRAVPLDSPLHEPAAYGEAWAVWQQGRFQDAKRLFEEWLRRWPQSTYRGAAFYALGMIERQLGNPAKGLEHLEKVQAVAPRSSWAEDAIYQLARSSYDAGDHQEAIARGRRLESQFARSRWLGPILWMRGESYLALGLHQDAVRAFSQLAVLGNQAFLAGQGEEVDYKIGMAHFYAGNYQEAARVLEAVDRGPLEDDATFWQAEARYRLGQYDSARALYGRLIARHPDFPRISEAYYGLGWAAYRLSDLTGSRNAYAEAIRRMGEGRTRQDATYRLGLVLVDLRDWDNARQTFEALLKGPVDPSQAADARFQIAWSLYRQGRLEEAASSFGNFAQAHAGNRLAPQALVWQGRSLFRLKRYGDAIAALQAAVGHAQATPGQQYEAREQLAAAYFNNGQFDESRRVYEALMAMGDLPADRVEELRQGVIQAYLKGGNFRLARQELLKRGAPGESDRGTLLAIGEAFYEKGAWDEVIETWQAAGAVAPPSLAFWAGKALIEKKQWAEAVRLLTTLRDTPDQELRPQVLYELARAHRGAGDLPLARETLVSLSEAYLSRPVAAVALLEAAEVARDQKDGAGAQNLYRRVAENRSFPLDRRRQAWMGLGDLHRAAKQWGPALLAYRGARGLGPAGSLGAGIGGYWAGAVLVEMRQFKEALRELQSLKFPENAEPLPSLAALKQGEALEQLGRWREAIDVYTRLAGQAPAAERQEARTRLDWIEKNVPKEMR